MYSCTMPVPDPGGGGGGGPMPSPPPPPPPRRGRGVLKNAHYMILRVYANGLFGLAEVWGGLDILGWFGFFNGPHDGFANS